MVRAWDDAGRVAMGNGQWAIGNEARAEVGGQRAEIRGQRAEIRGQTSAPSPIVHPTSVPRGLQSFCASSKPTALIRSANGKRSLPGCTT